MISQRLSSLSCVLVRVSLPSSQQSASDVTDAFLNACSQRENNMENILQYFQSLQIVSELEHFNVCQTTYNSVLALTSCYTEPKDQPDVQA